MEVVVWATHGIGRSGLIHEEGTPVQTIAGSHSIGDEDIVGRLWSVLRRTASCKQQSQRLNKNIVLFTNISHEC